MDKISLDVALDIKARLVETFILLDVEVSENLLDRIDIILMDYLHHRDRFPYVAKQY